MIKLSGSISRKLPIEGIQYSSQSFSAGMEVEVSDADKPDVIKERIRELYTVLSQSIDEQIAANQSQPACGNGQSTPAAAKAPAPTPVNRVSGQTAKANGNGKTVNATQAQCKAIFAICKSLNLDIRAVLAEQNVTDASQLTVKQASALIDQLKARQNGNAA